jgi:hypothetical protein
VLFRKEKRSQQLGPNELAGGFGGQPAHVAAFRPIFPVANTDFEGGYDGRGCGVRYFFGQIGPTQPYDMPYSIRVLHSQSARG